MLYFALEQNPVHFLGLVVGFYFSSQIGTADQVSSFICRNPSFGISACIFYHKGLLGGLFLFFQGCNNEQCDKI